ncbi:heat shock cognate 70 kDa protein-like [Rutidosis leptorrhynchoides]|uniref:heat shock cognate 70 kDa protein-like n=1 Tax=Rutidosis leptorrhynchoides TaxID=125765 RepID=UPI003A9A2780
MPTKNQVAMNPCNSGFDAKRLIGRRVSDPSVQSDIKLRPSKVMSGPANRPLSQVTYKGEEKQFAAEEISSMVLIKMREIPDKKMKELEGICNPIIAKMYQTVGGVPGKGGGMARLLVEVVPVLRLKKSINSVRLISAKKQKIF